jgi:uncharacterized membrane protein
MEAGFLTSYIEPVAKWLHIIAGVMWIGLLYFFNFINGAFTATMDAETKKKVAVNAPFIKLKKYNNPIHITPAIICNHFATGSI